MTRLSGLLVALGLLLAAVPGHAADGRTDQVRRAVDRTGVYVDRAQAQGHLDLWQQRLEEAVAASALPVKVALWSTIDGVAPDLDTVADGVLTSDGGPSVWTVSDDRTSQVVAHAAAPTARRRLDREVERLQRETRAVGDALVATLDDDVISPPRLIPVAHAWVWLRLSSAEPPRVAALAAELEPDAAVLLGRRGSAPDATPRPDDATLFSPIFWSAAALVVLATLAITIRLGVVEARRRRSRVQPLAVPEWARRLTPLSVSRELTALAEAIAAAPARPGDPDYDGAQARSDAAEAHEGSTRPRDLVGMHLLVAEGHQLLIDGEITPRCFFNPEHPAGTQVTRDGQRIPCCPPCARAVRLGRRPDLLALPDEEGRVVGYDEVDDVWSRTGYGTLNRLWAREALLAALEGRQA